VPTSVIDGLFAIASSKTAEDGTKFVTRLQAIDLMATIGTRSENAVTKLGELLSKDVETEKVEKKEFTLHVVQALGKIGPPAKQFIPQIVDATSIDPQSLDAAVRDAISKILVTAKWQLSKLAIHRLPVAFQLTPVELCELFRSSRCKFRLKVFAQNLHYCLPRQFDMK
jgi:hypothetical protein